MKSKAEVHFFRESGKWYSTEYFEFDDDMTWNELYNAIKEHYKDKYSGMSLVVTNFGSYSHGVPMMIPANFR